MKPATPGTFSIKEVVPPFVAIASAATETADSVMRMLAASYHQMVLLMVHSECQNTEEAQSAEFLPILRWNDDFP